MLINKILEVVQAFKYFHCKTEKQLLLLYFAVQGPLLVKENNYPSMMESPILEQVKPRGENLFLLQVIQQIFQDLQATWSLLQLSNSAVIL